MKRRFIAIMAGGRGERFWPESRLSRPKQLLPVVGEKAMLAQTVERIATLIPIENIFVITGAEQRLAVLEVCPELVPEKVISEPTGRDTTAAVALATLLVRREDPQASFAILPADAVIENVKGLQETLNSAFEVAEVEPVITTIAITARFPATGYGYIQKGDIMGEFASQPVYKVKQFVEKPDEATANQYLKSGDYFWNAGMFIWSVSTIVDKLKEKVPSIWSAITSIERGLNQGNCLEKLLNIYYPKIEKISIDYALIEKADNVVMIKARFDWDDVGEWTAIARHYPADDRGNVAKGFVEVADATNNIVYSRDDKHLIALLGVKDLIVVKSEDATLVCHKDKAQEVKKLVKQISASAPLKT